MSEWKEYKVEDIISEISMGPFGSDVKKEVYTSFGVPILNGANLQGFKLKEDSFGYVSEEKANSLKKCNAHRGDVVVTHRGTLGQIVYIPENSKFDRYVISQSQFRFTCNNNIVRPDFLVYLFHTKEGQHKILSNASQVGVPALARATTTFRQIKVKIPSLNVQNRIMNILSSLDDKIEVNRRINEKLEELAQALFKSWFVDFEPFKDVKFVESELGMIPEGWKVGTLGNVADVVMGASPAGSSYNTEGNGSIFYQGRTDFGFRFPNVRMYTTEPKRFAESNSVLLSVRAPVGDVNIAFEKCCIGRGLASIKSNSNADSYTYYLMKSLKPVLDNYNNEGTVFGCINKDALNNLSIVVPTIEIIKEFERIVSCSDMEIRRRSEEITHLTNLRDTLLPKLMSGEIDVNEVEI